MNDDMFCYFVIMSITNLITCVCIFFNTVNSDTLVKDVKKIKKKIDLLD